MMKLSKKGEYALKALIELAIDHDSGITVTLINDIAGRKGMPQKYLEQILLRLRNAGLLVSRRGIGGGYCLSRSPENITLGEIIRAVEGPFVPLDSAGTDARVEHDESSCVLSSVMAEVSDAISGVLDRTTLGDVVRRTIDLINQQNSVLNYAI